MFKNYIPHIIAIGLFIALLFTWNGKTELKDKIKENEKVIAYLQTDIDNIAFELKKSNNALILQEQIVSDLKSQKPKIIIKHEKIKTSYLSLNDSLRWEQFWATIAQ
jgi:uncharacterized protein YoxC